MNEFDRISRHLSYLDLNPPEELLASGSGAFTCASHLPFNNRGFLAMPDQEILEEIYNFFAMRPHTLWSDAANEAVKHVIESSGKYFFVVAYPIMQLELSIFQASTMPADITIRQLENRPEDTEVFLDVVSQAYASDKEGFRKFLAYLASAPGGLYALVCWI